MKSKFIDNDDIITFSKKSLCNLEYMMSLRDTIPTGSNELFTTIRCRNPKVLNNLQEKSSKDSNNSETVAFLVTRSIPVRSLHGGGRMDNIRASVCILRQVEPQILQLGRNYEKNTAI